MKYLTAWVLVLAVVAVTAPVASAQTDERGRDEPPPDDRSEVELERLRSAALREVDRRLRALQAALDATVGASAITEDHRNRLVASSSAARDGLLTIRASIETASSLPELRRSLNGIVDDHWVFLLVVPRTYEVIASDSIRAVVADLGIAHDAIEDAAERAAAAGLDVSSVRAALDDAAFGALRADEMAAAVADEVLALDRDDMPDEAGTLVRGSESLRRAVAELRSALGETRRAVGLLRAVVNQPA